MRAGGGEVTIQNQPYSRPFFPENLKTRLHDSVVRPEPKSASKRVEINVDNLLIHLDL
jgi:hypothetical protein